MMRNPTATTSMPTKKVANTILISIWCVLISLQACLPQKKPCQAQ